MSQWRRIALEAVPTCKRAIEEAKNPAQMWIYLYHELYSTSSAKEVADKQIYDFAFQCFKTRTPKVLAANVGLFLEYVIGGYVVGIERLREDLPGRISVSEFQHWGKWIKGNFSPDKYEEAVAQFVAAKRNPKFRIECVGPRGF